MILVIYKYPYDNVGILSFLLCSWYIVSQFILLKRSSMDIYLKRISWKSKTSHCSLLEVTLKRFGLSSAYAVSDARCQFETEYQK